MPNNMRMVEDSAEINLERLGFEIDTEAFSDLVAKAVTSAVADALFEDPPRLSVYPSSPPISDPATFYLNLPFDVKNDGECRWQISLADVLGYHYLEPDGNWDSDHYEPRPEALALAARLRELADWLEHGPPEAELQRWREQ
jgi:hypothetical protein